jgi:hypothetical protein
MVPNRLTLFAAISVCSTAPVAAQQTRDLAPYLMSDRAAEIALARTAAPKQITDSATVLVLTTSGYVESVHGKNGFTCFVYRSFDSPIGDPGFWDPTNRGPACFNPPAVRTVLPEVRKRAEWTMAGVSTTEIAKRTRKAYAAHTFPMPAAGAMAYMLSPEQRFSNTDSHWLPHLMFWFDRSLPSVAWGLSDANTAIIDGSAGDPNSPVRVLLIPVRRWSDGTLAIPGVAK